MNQISTQSAPKTLSTWIQECYRGSGWLTFTGLLMLFDILISLAGLALDHTNVMGDPAWLKPLKFAVSVALFSPTVAWMIGQLPRFRHCAGLVGKVMAVALVLEIILIDMQVARHTSSHFNIANNFDARVFNAMGIAIALILAGTAILFLLACIARFEDRSLAWAIRLSFALALAGMSTGVLMTLPTPEQLAKLHAGGGLPRSGAHTVGAPDGGRELPLTGWSVDHGDLRIAHFIGLHAMQCILLAWWLPHRRQWTCSRHLAFLVGIATSIAAAYAVVLVQALAGQPFLRPDSQTLIAWVLWMAATCGLLLWTLLQPQPLQQETR